jgi:hypothetical protein
MTAKAARQVMPLGNTALAWAGIAILVATVVAALLLMGLMNQRGIR